jgi:hypothetical protein
MDPHASPPSPSTSASRYAQGCGQEDNLDGLHPGTEWVPSSTGPSSHVQSAIDPLSNIFPCSQESSVASDRSLVLGGGLGEAT